MLGFFRRNKHKPEQDATNDPALAQQPPDPLPAPLSLDATLPTAPPSVSSAQTPSAEGGCATSRGSWFSRLREGLAKTRTHLSGLFSRTEVDAHLFSELEEALLTSDAGLPATTWLLDQLREVVCRQQLREPEQIRTALKTLLCELLRPLEKNFDINELDTTVILVSGVNGAGKTTSIGKLSRLLQKEGKTILLAAGDTFRAAAREQLAQWGQQTGVQVIASTEQEPASVAFDAVTAGRARKVGVVIVDTAGRLATQANLMGELKKVHRVIGKAMDGAPHHSLLILDGTVGQNMLAQVRAFDQAVSLSGLIVTKLDGTAKGGALAALAHERRTQPIPVFFVGVGEGVDDLQRFCAEAFADALLGD